MIPAGPLRNQGNSRSTTVSTKDKILVDFTAYYNKRLALTVSLCANK